MYTNILLIRVAFDPFNVPHYNFLILDECNFQANKCFYTLRMTDNDASFSQKIKHYYFFYRITIVCGVLISFRTLASTFFVFERKTFFRLF